MVGLNTLDIVSPTDEEKIGTRNGIEPSLDYLERAQYPKATKDALHAGRFIDHKTTICMFINQ